MKILFNDPNRLFGSEPGAVEKVNAALCLLSGVKSFKLCNKTIPNACASVIVGPDKWQTHIHLLKSKGRIVAYFYNGQFISWLDNPVELIYQDMPAI